MTDELIRMTATEAVARLLRRDITPLELIDAAAVRIAEVEPAVNALPTLCIDRARDHARRLMNGEGREAEAEEQGTDTMRNRIEAAARASALCLDVLLADNSVALEGAQIIDAFDRKFVLVAVHGLGGREAQLLTGTCEVRESAERSAVLAVLDATNRWADARR